MLGFSCEEERLGGFVTLCRPAFASVGQRRTEKRKSQSVRWIARDGLETELFSQSLPQGVKYRSKTVAKVERPMLCRHASRDRGPLHTV